MTTNTPLKYWKQDNVYFVAPVDGAVEQPALVVKGLTDLQQAMHELENVISNQDPLRQALQPPSESAETSLKLQILELIMDNTPENECLIWLDRSHEPRVEWLRDRSAKTVRDAFRQWLPTLDLTLPAPETVIAMRWIIKNSMAEANAAAPSLSTTTFTTTTTTTTTNTMSTTTSLPTTATASANAPTVNEQKVASVAPITALASHTTKNPTASTATTTDAPLSNGIPSGFSRGKIEQGFTAFGSAAEQQTDKAVAMETEKVADNEAKVTETPMEIDVSREEKAIANAPKAALERMDVGLHHKTGANSSLDMTTVAQTTEQTLEDDEMECSVASSRKNTRTVKTRTAPARVSIEPTERTRRIRGKAPLPPKVAEQRPDDEFVPVEESHVKKLLKKAGFKLKKRFALPDYSETFSTLQEMQEDMRRNGIPNFPDWSPEERLEVEKWVRQSIYRTGNFPDKLSVQSEISNFKDLMRIGGFKYRNSCLYIYPHVDIMSARQDVEFCFTDERVLMESLARNGLPEYLYTEEKLTREELLAIEYYTDTFVYLPSDPNHRRNLFVREWIGSKKRDRCGGDSEERDNASLSSTSSKKKSRTTPPKEKKTLYTPSKGKKIALFESNMVTPAKSKKRSPIKSRTIVMEDPSTPTTAVTMATIEASVDALPWPPVIDPAQEIEGASDWERLVNAQAALSKTADKPVFAETSSLSDNLKAVQNMVHAVFRSTGRHGGEVRNGKNSSCKALYVCGVPGTGKTLSVSWICSHVLKLQKEGAIGVELDDDDDSINWCFLLQNANSVRNSDAFRANIASELGVKPRSDLSKILKRKGLILVVDEIDSMVNSAEMKNLLHTLLGYANDGDMRFALIGISNSQMDDKFVEVQESGDFQEVITFSAYTESDLLQILIQRIGRNLMDKNAMQMIVLKCKNDKGDARSALDLAAGVVKARLEYLDEDSSTLTDGPLIQVPHVVAMNRKQNRSLIEQIDGLPQTCKLCLVVLITLGRKNVTESTVGQVYKFVVQCLSSLSNDEGEYLTSDDFERCLEALKDSGLLRLGTVKNLNNISDQQKVNVKICLGLQLEDVQIAVDKVCRGEIYEKIANATQNNIQQLQVVE